MLGLFSWTLGSFIETLVLISSQQPGSAVKPQSPPVVPSDFLDPGHRAVWL